MLLDTDHTLSARAEADWDRIDGELADLALDTPALDSITGHPGAVGDLAHADSNPLLPYALVCSLTTDEGGDISGARWEIRHGEAVLDSSSGWVTCDGESAMLVFARGARVLAGMEPTDNPQLIEGPMTSTEMHAIRTAHGLSIADMARYLDASERSVRYWEGGRPIPDGVAAEVRGIDGVIDGIAEQVRDAWRTARKCGTWSVDMPLHQADTPSWGAVEDPMALWTAGAARAVEKFGVRLTSPRDAR